jgi:hypothetical protein
MPQTPDRPPRSVCSCHFPPWLVSRRRHTAQEQPFDVLIQYPQHPRAGERVLVVRRSRHGGSVHFVIEQPDGTRALLQAWMTEPWAAQFTIIEMPRLTLDALYALRRATNGALLSLSSSIMMRGECNDGATSRPLDLLARAANTREQNQTPPPLRAEVRFMLTLLMAEHLAIDPTLPVEARNE